jgi:hypothetical protein
LRAPHARQHNRLLRANVFHGPCGGGNARIAYALTGDIFVARACGAICSNSLLEVPPSRARRVAQNAELRMIFSL